MQYPLLILFSNIYQNMKKEEQQITKFIERTFNQINKDAP